ncbi:MAG: acetyl-CoA decarbonylase/synthase complex subunit gamma [Promethearchaeota archaeon]
MVKRPGPLDIYKLLPKKADWSKLGLRTGMEFVTELMERRVKLDDFPGELPEKKRKKILELITPPQRAVEFGVGPRMCVIGGEEAFHRHDLTFFNQTAIAVDVSDEQPDMMERVKYITDFVINRIGEDLKLDAIAVRCVSNDPEKYTEAVKKISENTDMPLILCSWNADALIKAAEAIKDKKPLLYAATKQNWKQVGECAVKNGLPVVCFSTDLNELASLTKTLESMGVKEIVLDPGTSLEPGFISQTLDKIQQIRYASIKQGDEVIKWPVIGVPATVWINGIPSDEDEKFAMQYREALGAIMMLSVDVSLVIIHTGGIKEEIWCPLALVTYRQNIFTDPRIYPRVDAGLYQIGEPDKNSPVFMTSNYRMTKIPVEQDLKDAHINGWLLVVDTDGLGIEAGVAGGQLNAEKVAEAIKQYKVFEKVDHRILVIPGLAARLQGAIEDEADCYVSVGPKDSSGIQRYMEETWNPEEFMKEYEERK